MYISVYVIGRIYACVEDRLKYLSSSLQGAIQGPEEFAEGLMLGVQRMLGGTVGGAAGAVSRITGTFGKGLAALSLDKEFQKERLEQQQRRRHHATITSGMAHNIQGLGRVCFLQTHPHIATCVQCKHIGIIAVKQSIMWDLLEY